MSTLYGLGSEIGEEITLYPGDFSLTLDTETDTLEVEIYNKRTIRTIYYSHHLSNKRQMMLILETLVNSRLEFSAKNDNILFFSFERTRPIPVFV